MITVVGCGFLGSLFVEEVAKRSFAYHEPVTLRLIDPDKVEERNSANQLWDPSDAGALKVNCLGSRLSRYSLDYYTFPMRLTEDSAKELLYGTQLLVCAVDNIPTRVLLWQMSVALDIPLLSMGISQGGTGGVEWTYLSKMVDTNTFSPARLALVKDVEALGKVEHLPPCELVGFRGLGLNVALSAAKALWIYIGWDAERDAHPTGHGDPGKMTMWEASNYGHKLTGVSK
jgi:hypothetical protein